MIQPEIFIDYVMKRYPLANTINRHEFRQRGLKLDRLQSQVIQNFFDNWDYNLNYNWALHNSNLETNWEIQLDLSRAKPQNRPYPMSEADILLATSLLIPAISRPPGKPRKAITGDQRQAIYYNEALQAMGIPGVGQYLGNTGGKRKSKRKSRKFR
jgi:hypothetical protein